MAANGSNKHLWRLPGSEVFMDTGLLVKCCWMIGLATLAVIPVFSMWDLVPWLITYDEKRVAASASLVVISVFVALSSTFADKVLGTFKQLPTPSVVAMGFVVALALITITGSPIPMMAAREVALYGLLAILVFYVAATYRILGQNSVNGMVLVLIVFSLVYSLRSIIESVFYLLEAYIPPEGGRAYNFANARFFNQLQAWTLPLLIYAGSTGNFNRIIRKAAFAGAVGWVVLALYSGGAGIAISLLISCFMAILLLGWRHNKKYIWCYGQVILGGLVAHYVLFELLPPAIGFHQSSSHLVVNNVGLSGREQLWAVAWHWIQHSPWLGNGPLNLVVFHNNPHNAVLQWLAEWGVLSTILIAAIMAWGFYRWIAGIRQKQVENVLNDDAIIDFALTVSALSGAVLAMVSAVIVTPFSQLLMCVVIGLMLGRHYSGNGEPGHEKKINILGVRAICLLFVVVYSKVTLPEVLDRYSTRNGYVMSYIVRLEQSASLSPRFWQFGPYPQIKPSIATCIDYPANTPDFLCIARMKLLKENKPGT